ncbi:MAG: outer membrane beta-barrel protein [Bacteroidota bacterium]|nr:outer membrane beta-barrel protein [Bacteroidota bacterium]
MKKFIFTAILSLMCGILFAQTVGTVKGKLIDSIGKQSLKDASVEILIAKDSSRSMLGLAKADGSFEIKNIPLGNYIIRISFQSYVSQFRNIKIAKANQEINVGNIYLVYSSDRLPDVVVTQSPVQIKKDTVEFNASNFTVKPNAVAEDLLKKIPGMDVDKSGAIKSQGETVQRVLVNGKRFFGDDPKMATKNLPPDVIDKIQVFDDLSDQSKFTGFDDGNRVKTINITTKKNTSKGYFGKAVAAAGTDGNYDESFNMHRFDGNTQISALGQANNINKQNFTPQDMSGGGGGRGGGGFNSGSSGITTTLGAGLNMKTSWGKLNSSAYGSYFYNDLKGDVEQQSLTQTLITADSSTFKNSVSSSASNTANHRVNFNLEENFDSSNSLVARPNIAFQTSTPNSSSSTTTTGTTGSLINNSVNTSSSYNSGYNINGANAQLRHRFNKKFRTISLDLNFSNSANDGNGYSYAVNSFYGTHPNSAILNQYYVDSFHSFSFTPTLSYTEPIAKNQILEFRYSFNTNTNHSVNNTYEYNTVTKIYDKFDSLYSNSYKYNASSNTLSVSYRLQEAKYNFNIGTGLQYTDYKSENTVKNIIVAHNYVNITPTANFTYNFKKTENLRIFYSGRTGQPSVTNLQPLKTISGLDTAMGNPDLKPQFVNSVRLLYTSFDPVTQHIMFATINASATTNDIQSSIIQHSNGTKTTTYANLNGTYNINGYFNYGFALKKPKSNLNFATNIGYTQSQTLVSTDSTLLTPKSNFTKNTTLGETVKWTTNLKDNFDMNLSAGTNYVIAYNTLNPTQNANYFVHTVTTDFTFYTKSGWILASDFTYTYSGNRPPGYNASVPLINPSIAKQFFKNKAGELRLTIFDLLNQNVAVSRSVSTNTIVDSKTNVLKQYFMLTFTYNLRNFAGQQQKMPNMFRGMRPPGFGGDGGHFGGWHRD